MTIKFDETTKRWTLGDIAVGQLLAIVKGTALLASHKNNPYEEAKEVDEFFEKKLYSLPEIKKTQEALQDPRKGTHHRADCNAGIYRLQNPRRDNRVFRT